MKISLLIVTLHLSLLSIHQCFARDNNDGDLKFAKSVYRQTGFEEPFNSLYIEKLVLKKSAAIGKTQVLRINRALEERYASVYAEARSCHEPEFRHPWGYRFLHQKIYSAHGVLGIVFDFQADCGGGR